MTENLDLQYAQAVGLVILQQCASTSNIQRHLGIRYNAAARLVERMEEEGIVSNPNHVGKRVAMVPLPSKGVAA